MQEHTLIKIVRQLPGAVAREVRRSSANTVCRVLGGDLGLVREMEARYETLQSTTEGQGIGAFVANDTYTATHLTNSNNNRCEG
jgi:hypothetical protein